MSWLTVLAFLLPLLLLSLRIEAAIHVYKDEKFTAKGDVFVVHAGSEGLCSSQDSYIRFERIEFHRNKDFTNFSSWPVHAVVLEGKDRKSIGGSANGDQMALCCTVDLAKLGECTEGQFIHHPSTENSDIPQVFSVSFDTDDEVSKLPPKSIEINKTGMYDLYFIHCDPRLKELVVKGKTVWKNPSGYLPGGVEPMQRLYNGLALHYSFIWYFWFFHCGTGRDQFPLKNCISLLVALGGFEVFLWCLDYAQFNEAGIGPPWTTVWAVTFGCAKSTMARLIILSISMGYGIVRPLGGLKSKKIMVMLGGIYFLASEVLGLAENVGGMSDLCGDARLFSVLPVVALDGLFILWIFTSLYITFNKLKARRMMVKLDFYMKFRNSLVQDVIFSAGLTGYELFFKSSDIYNEYREIAWLIVAARHILSYSLLCVICPLFALPQNSTRYAYRVDGGGDDFDREL